MSLWDPGFLRWSPDVSASGEAVGWGNLGLD